MSTSVCSNVFACLPASAQAIKRRHWLLVCLAASLLILAPGANDSAFAQPAGAPRLQILVPAYFYPAGDGLKHWDNLIAAASRSPIVAIANADSGPGKAVDPNYTKVLDRAKKGNVTLIGYVSTRYGKRPLDEAKADVDRWIQFYPQIHGVFVDEQASAADQVAYYAALYQHVRMHHSRKLVFTNPGTLCAEDYLSRPAADTACVFEAAKGFDKFQLPKWADKYQPSRFAALSYYIATAEQMQQFAHAAVSKKIGYVYFTDAAGSNPWDRLPRYWDQEVELVQKINDAKAP